jgi:hypothetical protein
MQPVKGRKMNRFFFDVSSQTYAHYDFRGREFARSDEARELAELIALDIGCTEDTDCAPAEVQVRNVRGERLFSVSVPRADAIAA